MDTLAVVLQKPETLELSRVDLVAPGATDVVVDIEWSGISTGTEKLLWTGRMPMFPGMGYPLVPGYESVGRIAAVGASAAHKVGTRVFVPGSRGFKDVRGLFGGAAKTLVVAADKALPFDENWGEQGVLLALAATAYRVFAPNGHDAPLVRPDLIVGHGVLGRLIARIAVATGSPAPTVWETNPQRATGATGYAVVDPANDARRDYKCICDVSGDASLLDQLIQRLAPGGEIVLAGFYAAPIQFSFAPAFMREARLRISAEFKAGDLAGVQKLIESGRLSLDGLVTHRQAADTASDAYRTAFADADCLKMVLDWRNVA